MSYPTSDASVMAVTLNCVEFFTVCFMILAYIPHVILSFCWPAYRPLHQHGGIGGLQVRYIENAMFRRGGVG